MEQQKGYSVSIIGVACFFIALGSILAAGGLSDATGSQGQQWAKTVSAFLSFSGGYLFIEIEIRRVQRRFTESVARQEQKLGRFLSFEEREEIKKRMRAAISAPKDNPGFGHPMVRFVARILIVAVPAVILMGVLAAGGAFLAGLGMAILIVELTRRTLDHL